MIHRLVMAAAALVLPFSAAAQEKQRVDPSLPPIEVMVLGSFHFANPGRDAVNVTVDDMLAPKRQAELDALAEVLAQWKPTRIAIEAQSSAPDLALASYADADRLIATERDESYQIGYRLARKLGHKAVYGFDEQPGPGEPDYFPLDKAMAYAEAHGQAGRIAELIAEVQAEAARQEAALPNQTVAEALLVHNEAARVDAMHDRLYYGLMAIGDAADQPGAELNAYWYMRNAKMFAKLGRIAGPGDRVLVLVGSGHGTWLRHFASHVPGVVSVDPAPLLMTAIPASKPQ